MTSNHRTSIGAVLAGAVVAAVFSACAADTEAPANDIGGVNPASDVVTVDDADQAEGVNGVPGTSRCAVSPREARAERRNLCTE